MLKKILGITLAGIISASPLHTVSAQTLNNVVIKSKASVRQSEIDSVISGYLGKDISVNLLKDMLKDLTAFYKAHGYLAAQAFYPEQKSTNGVIEVVVETARLNEVKFNNLNHVSMSTLYKLFDRVRALQNQTINTSTLNEELLKVRDLNVFDIAAYFENAANAANAADLTIDIKPKSRFGFQAFYDNYGNKSTGKHRFVAALTSTNLTSHADRASLLLARTDESQTSFSLHYDIPVSTRLNVLGFNLGYSGYELGDEYEDLDARGSIFTSDVHFRIPLHRSMSSRIGADTSLYYKRISDSINAYDIDLKRHSFGTELELTADNFFEKMRMSHGVKFNYGKVSCDDDYHLTDDKSFFITSLSGLTSFDINSLFNISNRIELQIGSTSLDSSDKFIVGGAQGVRAFNSNVASSDHGLFDDLKLTLRVHSNPQINLYTDFMQAYAKNHNGDTKESFYGLGFGAEFFYHGFFINSSLNKAVGNNRNYAEDSLKFLIKFGYYQD